MYKELRKELEMENEKHFRLLKDDSIEIDGVKLYRIQATKNIPQHYIAKGEKGGYIEKEDNLSDEAWVGGNAKVYGYAKVCEKARISDNVEVCGNAYICGRAKVFEDVKVFENAEVCGNAQVYGMAVVSGDAFVSGNAEVCGNAEMFGDVRVSNSVRLSGKAFVGSDDDLCFFSKFGSENRNTTFFRTKDGDIFVTCGCFRGTLEKFEKQVKRTHGDNKFAKEYLAMIELVKIKFGLP